MPFSFPFFALNFLFLWKPTESFPFIFNPTPNDGIVWIVQTCYSLRCSWLSNNFKCVCVPVLFDTFHVAITRKPTQEQMP
jgi:hypothetical protein